MLDQRLERCVVGAVVSLEHARNDGADIGGGAERGFDDLRRFSLPLRPDQLLQLNQLADDLFSA